MLNSFWLDFVANITTVRPVNGYFLNGMCVGGTFLGRNATFYVVTIASLQKG